MDHSRNSRSLYYAPEKYVKSRTDALNWTQIATFCGLLPPQSSVFCDLAHTEKEFKIKVCWVISHMEKGKNDNFFSSFFPYCKHFFLHKQIPTLIGTVIDTNWQIMTTSPMKRKSSYFETRSKYRVLIVRWEQASSVNTASITSERGLGFWFFVWYYKDN